MKPTLDLKGPRATAVYVLLHNGTMAGKIIANFSDNPNGSVCQATVWLYKSDLSAEYYTGTGRAGGYGYDKLSAAIYQAVRGHEPCAKIIKERNLSGGDGRQETLFEAMGYEVLRPL